MTTTVAADEARRVAQHEANNFRVGAIDDVTVKDREVAVARHLARGSGVIEYIFYLIYGLLAVRLVLAMVAARSGNGFVRLIQAVTDPFYGMFRSIVPSPAIDGGYTLVLPIIVAIVAYALLHTAINGALCMVANRKTEI
jgi:uncharacterized protein YggT (Ycf19 family)